MVDHVKNYVESVELREKKFLTDIIRYFGKMITKICILTFFLVNLYTGIEEVIC